MENLSSHTSKKVILTHTYVDFVYILIVLPKTSVGHDSSRDVSPLRKIWCRKSTVSELRKIELTSSWEHGGRFDDAAILNGRRKHDTSTCGCGKGMNDERKFCEGKFTSSCSRYSSSASTMLNTRLFRFRMLSACGDLMYSSTICFHRRRHSQPRKKLCTFLIFRSSMVSSTDSHRFDKVAASLMAPLSVWGSAGATVVAAALKLPRPTGVAEKEERVVSFRSTQI